MSLLHVLLLNREKLVEGPEGILESLRSFIDLNGKLDLRVKRVLKANDIGLVITEWSFNGTGRDGKHVHMAAKSADVLRQQSDGTWRFIIDIPWGNRSNFEKN